MQALAATLPPGFAETLLASGLSNPTAMAFAPDGRLFVCLQGGQVRVIDDGVLLGTPFVNLTVDSSGERGLLGLAFDPDFSTNHYVYIYYTATTPSTHNRVSRLVANGNVAVPGSETAILDLDPLGRATNHNGGALHFGIDGKLYVGVGENAASSNAQSLNNLLGKILRINADGTIPADNPFVTQTTGVNRAIWALGLRNPLTFAFEPLSGRLLINDVGQNTYEEIDDGLAGFNYGWPASEGPASDPNHTSPIYFYPHVGGPVAGCAITGGTFYNPASMLFPASFLGTYFFADYCGGWIKYLDPENNNTVTGFATGISNPVDLRVGPDGGLYYLSRSAGSIFKIFYTGSATRGEAVLTDAASRTNVALASAGAVAVASSMANSNFPASAAINGDRRGVGWGAGGGWNDGTAGVFPDWLEVDFNDTYPIDEVDVFTLQDSYGAPSDPTPAMTFGSYGLRDFDVQYWNGSSWQTVTGGHITGNTNVWRTIAFPAVSTNRIRIFVTSALASYSRIVEVEAYQGAGPANTPPTVNVTSPAEGASVVVSTPTGLAATATDADGTVARVDFYANGTLVGTDMTSPYAATWTPSAAGAYTLTAVATDNLDAQTTSAAVHVTVTTGSGGRTNVALASAGAVAVASSIANSNFPPSAAINGDRRGVGWGAGGGWNDGTAGVFPDWLEVDFNGTYPIDEVDVFTLQDNYGAPSDPTPAMTFGSYGLRDFDVQYWNGSSWQTVTGGHIIGNTNVWRTIAFPAVSTNRIRTFVTNALSNYSRIVEVEAYTGGVPDTQPPVVTNLQPVDGSIVSGPVALAATATDDVGVAGVQFQVDGVNVGSEDQLAPYGATWDSLSVGNGPHVVTAVARDGAGNTATASATVTVGNTLTTFPLRVGSDLRHLVDQNSVPFLVNGDAAWSLIVGLQKPDASVYLADRSAKGLNTLLVNLVEHHFSVNPPRNAYGDAPFTTPGDFSTPNESYFAHAEWVINEAASRGMLVLLVPAYLGFGCGVEGWCQEMNANGTTKMFNYGVYLGNRYKNFKNILWVHGGDTNANAFAGTGDIVRAVINGIKSVDGPRVHTGHCNRETSALDCYDEPWLDVNTTYSSCSASAMRTRTDYNRARMMPFFYIEGTYENEGASNVCLRSQAYWSILGGSSGHVFGNNPIWPFTGPAWQQALNSTGAQSMANLGALFRARAWQTLVPDYLHQVVTAGFGNITDATYVPASRASDGSMAIAYLPGGGTITVDMTRLSGPAAARWYDPVAGTFTPIAGSPFANTGSRNFATPGANAGGNVDWVLVLETTPH